MNPTMVFNFCKVFSFANVLASLKISMGVNLVYITTFFFVPGKVSVAYSYILIFDIYLLSMLFDSSSPLLSKCICIVTFLLFLKEMLVHTIKQRKNLKQNVIF